MPKTAVDAIKSEQKVAAVLLLIVIGVMTTIVVLTFFTKTLDTYPASVTMILCMVASIYLASAVVAFYEALDYIKKEHEGKL